MSRPSLPPGRRFVRTAKNSTEKRRLFFTHCSKTKDDRLRQTGDKVAPNRLYLAPYVQKFCRECERLGLTYAIFSDLHGFVFPTDRIRWYDKSPGELLRNDEERTKLFDKAYTTLRDYSETYFYHLPKVIRRLHPLYRMLIDEMTRKGIRITEITDLSLLSELSKAWRFRN